MTLMDDIRRHWRRRNYVAPLRLQRGGSNKNSNYNSLSITRHILHVGFHPIEYIMDTKKTTIYIYGGNNPETSPCFELHLELADNTALLQQVERRPRCFTDGHAETRDVVRATYILARNHGVKSLELTDHSLVYCPEEVRLADMSFLTTGQTWYESILPFTCRSVESRFIEEYRNKVRTNTWRTVGHGIIDIDITDVDIDAPGSAMLVLNAMKKSGQFCWFFAEHMSELRRRSGIESLYGSRWVCDIDQGSMRKRTTVKRRRTRT